jgi:hypothetical protein
MGGISGKGEDNLMDLVKLLPISSKMSHCFKKNWHIHEAQIIEVLYKNEIEVKKLQTFNN